MTLLTSKPVMPGQRWSASRRWGERGPGRRAGKRRAGKQSWLALLCGVLLVALTLETSARVLERSFIDAPDGFNLPAIGGQVATMREKAAAGGAQVLVLGSSVAVGVDPDRLAATSQRYDRAFTLWSAGAGVRTLAMMYEDLAKPILAPEVVVLTLTSRELNALGDGLARNLRAFESAPARRAVAGDETWLQQLDRSAADHSALIRVRPLVREPGRLFLALRSGKTDGDESRWWETWKNPPVGWTSTPEHAAQERRSLESYRVDGPELDALRRFVGELRADGVRVVVVSMPVFAEEYDTYSQRGAADREAFQAAMDATCAELQVECFDTMTLDWELDDFSNANHVNDVGTPKLTDLVARVLDEVD